MKTAIAISLFVVACAFAGHRSITTTMLDTIKITNTYNDTTILVKSDTVILKAAPVAKPKGK